jgi:transcription-repair coupling factor (superfamily II helicase)
MTDRNLILSKMQADYKQNLKLFAGQKIKLFSFIEWLTNAGYERMSEIDTPGQYIMLGDTLTLWPVNHDCKMRIDFFGNLIENIYQFNIKNQKSKMSILRRIFLSLMVMR